jgi:hypothetical protein
MRCKPPTPSMEISWKVYGIIEEQFFMSSRKWIHSKSDIHGELCSNDCHYPAWPPYQVRGRLLIQSFPLDCPIKRLCHNVILRPKPKNLVLQHIDLMRFFTSFRMTNLHFKVITTQPPSRATTETESVWGLKHHLKSLLLVLHFEIECGRLIAYSFFY